jgi:lipopolysaccharide/colanic/teichoic acid biosynthesis glycosyltransferase
MRIWPIIIDSQPSYLNGATSTSLLLAPFGANTLAEQVVAALAPITANPPVVLAPSLADPGYAAALQAICPEVRVATGASEITDALSTHELSDALLIVDPRHMPVGGFEFSELMHHHSAEPRVAHHLVAFEAAVAGTKERVSFDVKGQVRGIHRYYEQATWPFVSAVTATVVPCASDVHAEGFIPSSLAELRQALIGRGVPSRDLVLEGGALELAEERGLLAANEQLVLKVSAGGGPVYVGRGHVIHATARIIGPVVVHPRARIGQNVTIVGPAVIGANADVHAGAVVAHATVGADCIVPAGHVVRDRAWFSRVREAVASSERAPLPYGERLARLSMDSAAGAPVRQEKDSSRRPHLIAKRALDITAASLALLVLLPLLAVIAVFVRLESGGSAFYADKREGWGGRVFKCWKFRTMITGAHLAQRELKALDHTDGPHFKVDGDPRVTKVGRILRALNLDEIPQLFNVLIGEMSLVGPRPSPFRENQVCVPWREARLSVRPGITGFWQVCRHNRAAGDFHQWIEYDLLYVQHLSFWLDMKILAATVFTLGGKVLHVPSNWLVANRLTGGLSSGPPPIPQRHTTTEEAVA